MYAYLSLWRGKEAKEISKKMRQGDIKWDRGQRDREHHVPPTLILCLKVEIPCHYKIILTLDTLHFTSDEKVKLEGTKN